MKLDKATSTVLGCSVSGYYKWKKEGRPIIGLLEKYFTKEDLREFLETGEIKKQDLVKDKSISKLKECLANTHNAQILSQIEELKQKQKELEKQIT